ncbi:MAG: alpha-glucan family phosphorylase [candidate division Zixibacteria bacterium]|nr:alpha-glucan family phosphorylase [candidate division Zixibacteria bacterium]MCK4606341.1 alpha-glucan family phosphorylase [candidate division Zixibacteria bacterium]
MRLRQFLVLPKLPPRVKALQELAQNLWYSWNWDMVKLFIRLDPDIWEECYQNPVWMLSRLPQETLERAAEDDGFVASLDRVCEKYSAYMGRKKWFDYKYSHLKDRAIAYFSLEFGLDTGLPVYSGGLGVLSGDTLKSASDLGLPMTAVGLLYRYGYFRQFLSSDGWQQERYEENDWYHMPVQLVKGEDDRPLRVSVDIDGTPVQIQIWKVSVGLIPLYLLDTNIPENSSKCREITSVLYGGDKNMRIRQEIILGIGGVRALRAMGVEPSVFHLNEGHSWFLTTERIRSLIREENLTFAEAVQYVWSTTVFTTHTPVPAGNERFDPVLVHRYLGSATAELGIGWKEFLALGRVFPDDETETFCMTVAALKTAAFANGVSKLHGHVSRNMWHNIWPNLPVEEVPIKSITNGVHTFSWVSHNMKELYESYFGAEYVEKSGPPEVWKQVCKIPDAELWRVHNRRRERLVFFARKRLKQQLTRRGASQLEVQRADQILDPQILTIGFARRFSTYKRGNLIFSDLDRLDNIVNNTECPIQLIISGKAHPLDTPGKEIIKQIVGYASEDRFRGRIIFLEDYDINVARYLVQGVDVWLNNPRRPQEASGTSGMKAAANGALNLSVLDGWWVEGFSEETGFKIGSGEEYDSVETQDRFDAEMLFNTLERELIPLFYDRNEIGLPVRWITKMKATIQMAGERFSAQRMLMDYTDQCYIPAIQAGVKMRSENHRLTRQIAGWLEKMEHGWDKIVIRDVGIPEMGPTLFVGQEFPITIKVFLGEITPDDIQVQIVSGQLDSQEQIHSYDPTLAALLRSDNNPQQGENGVYSFTGEVVCRESGRFGITARIVPKSEDLPHTIKPKLIRWW